MYFLTNNCIWVVYPSYIHKISYTFNIVSLLAKKKKKSTFYLKQIACAFSISEQLLGAEWPLSGSRKKGLAKIFYMGFTLIWNIAELWFYYQALLSFFPFPFGKVYRFTVYQSLPQLPGCLESREDQQALKLFEGSLSMLPLLPF